MSIVEQDRDHGEHIDRLRLLAQVTAFLTYEADLLDDWRLEEWLALFDADCAFEILPLSDGAAIDDDRRKLYVAQDDYVRLTARVHHLVNRSARAEAPRSRTRRLTSNARIIEADKEVVVSQSNFIATQFRNGESWQFIGSVRHELRPNGDSFRIWRKLVQLDDEAMTSQRRISILL